MLDSIVNILEKSEKEEINIVKSAGSDNYYINSMCGNDYPNIVFRINKKKLILSNIFLKNVNNGVGTLVIQKFIELAKRLNCCTFEIRIVKRDNERMIHLANKFKMTIIENDDEYYDFTLNVECMGDD